MTPPFPRPRQLSLGPLETEILEIIWSLGQVTAREVHERILADPDRELAYASVTTVLNRLTQKGWIDCDKQNRSFVWRPLITQAQARALQSYEQLQQFLAVSSPEIVAAFADHLDQTSAEQLEAIAQRLRALRQRREEE